MKNLLILVTITFMLLLSCSVNERKLDEMKFRNDICYYDNEETPYTGKVLDFYEGGSKKLEANYKKGKLHGLEITWYENGNKKAEVNFKDGMHHGLKTVWYEHGRKQVEVNFENDQPVGKIKSWKYKFIEEGKVKSGEIPPLNEK